MDADEFAIIYDETSINEQHTIKRTVNEENNDDQIAMDRIISYRYDDKEYAL